MVQHGAALARESGEPALAEAVASGEIDGLPPRLRALLGYAVKLTRAPALMAEKDVEALRSAGLDDRAVVDANQVVSYFNYVNRIADGLGVELEAAWPAALQERRHYEPAASDPGLPSVRADAVPWLSLAEVAEMERLMIEELGIALERMMENAGRGLAELARRRLDGSVAGRRIVAFAGPGGNGGGGLVAARHLAVAGAAVEVRLATGPERLAPVPATQHAILVRMGVPISGPEGDLEAELLLDSILGYGLEADPRGGAAELIERTRGARVLSLDVPSGLELASGSLREPHVQAEATLALAAPKEGLRAPGTGDAVGELFLADISVPPWIFEKLGLRYASPFGSGALVRIVS